MICCERFFSVVGQQLRLAQLDRALLFDELCVLQHDPVVLR